MIARVVTAVIPLVVVVIVMMLIAVGATDGSGTHRNRRVNMERHE